MFERNLNALLPLIFSVLMFSALGLSSCGGNKSEEQDKYDVLPDIDTSREHVSNEKRIRDQISGLNRKVADNPSNAALYYERAKLNLKIERYSMAVDDAQKAIELNPQSVQYRNLLGDIFWEVANPTGALRAYREAIELDPENEYAYIQLGRVHFYVQNREESIRNLNAALRLNSYNAEAYYYKAFNYKEDGFINIAISNLHSAVEANPEFYEAYMLLGSLSAEKNDRRTPHYFNNAINIKADAPQAYYARGIYYHEVDSLELAFDDFIKTLELEPSHSGALFRAGLIALNIYELESSVEYFTRVLRERPDMVEAYYGRGLANKFLGRYGSARRDFESVLQLDESFVEAEKELLEVYKALEE